MASAEMDTSAETGKKVLGKRTREPEPQRFFKDDPGEFEFSRGVVIEFKTKDPDMDNEERWFAGTIVKVEPEQIKIHIPRVGNFDVAKNSDTIAKLGTHTNATY
eukprot:GABV01011438.1.p3 GENE.GABV01011438.1~~GABV01011438.1.p3  ORF type:complete len:104 (-),score=34.38 GABV01011438.1:15-326(-)